MTTARPSLDSGKVGVQPSQPLGSVPPRATPPRVQSHAHAEQTLSDVGYLVYILVQAAKLFQSLAAKRWPEAR